MRSTRTLLGITMIVLAVACLTACSEAPPVEATFVVEGMTCESCSTAITDALNKMEGVEQASADHAAGTARAVVHDTEIAPDRLAAEIESLGFTVTSTESSPIEG